MNHKNFGHNLNHILDLLDMSQADLADRAGLTQAAISQIISGKRVPSLKTVCAILDAVPVTFGRLVSDVRIKIPNHKRTSHD